MPLLTPTGGLVYHTRALRSRDRWRPFCDALGEWLSDWTPACDGLILVGPSGGYTIPSTWLTRFENVVAIDFDPLASPLFARRHAHSGIEWILENVLPVGPRGLDLEPLSRRLDDYPSHAVLFSNVLGQLALDAPCPDAVEGDLGRLRSLLDRRSWASYHDRLSASMEPRLPGDLRHRPDVELARLAYAGGEVVSHSTGLIGRGLDCATFAWECQRGWWNLIEACRSAV